MKFILSAFKKSLKEDTGDNMKYEYVHGSDVFPKGDNNNGLMWGVEEVGDFPDYVEWFGSLNKLLEKTKDMEIVNKEQFLSRFQKTHKIDKGGKVRKIPTRNVHGISVRERKSGKLVEFIQCETGRPALRILSGIRMNMSPDYKAEETFVSEEEIAKMKEEEG